MILLLELGKFIFHIYGINILDWKHIDTWSKHIDKLNPIAIKVLIGNKLDLIHDRKVSTEEAQKYAAMNSMDYYELSAKDDINVSECFLNIGRKIINEYEYILINLNSNDNDITINFCLSLDIKYQQNK